MDIKYDKATVQHSLDDSFQIPMARLSLVSSYQTQTLSVVYCIADVEFESKF